jgi:hypothetical protein
MWEPLLERCAYDLDSGDVTNPSGKTSKSALRYQRARILIHEYESGSLYCHTLNIAAARLETFGTYE